MGAVPLSEAQDCDLDPEKTWSSVLVLARDWPPSHLPRHSRGTIRSLPGTGLRGKWLAALMLRGTRW